MTPVVELTDLSRSFGVGPKVYALAGVNLTINEGEWVAVVGPSGSGKSTLLNVLGLLDRPTGGSYLLGGVDVSKLDQASRAGVRSREIGFVFQSFHLLSHRSVTENVMVADIYRRGSRADRRDRALEMLAQVKLEHRADYLPTRLSGGERQRVAIARALLCSPRLVLADEPTGNLDSVTSLKILDLLAEMHARGLTIVMITHDEQVAAHAQRTVGIIDGQLTEVS